MKADYEIMSARMTDKMLMWTNIKTVQWWTGPENLKAKPANWALKLKVYRD